MMKSIALVLLMAVSACKSETASTPTAASSQDDVAGDSSASGTAPRSGKIDVPRRPNGVGPRLDGDRDRRVDGDGMRGRRDRMMAHLDTDGDGQISDAEREAGRAAREAERAKREAERTARLDTDKDGTVSDAERAAARTARMTDMRARLDADGDGKLTVDEALASRRMGFDAATLDTDKNGDVSAEELDKAMGDRFRGGRGGPGRWRGRGGRGGDGSGSASE